MVCITFGPKCSAWIPPGIEPATQSITDKDRTLNYSYIAPSVSTNLMICMTIFTSDWLLSDPNSFLLSPFLLNKRLVNCTMQIDTNISFSALSRSSPETSGSSGVDSWWDSPFCTIASSAFIQHQHSFIVCCASLISVIADSTYLRASIQVSL